MGALQDQQNDFNSSYGDSEQYKIDIALCKEWWDRVYGRGEKLGEHFDQSYQNKVNAASARLITFNESQGTQTQRAEQDDEVQRWTQETNPAVGDVNEGLRRNEEAALPNSEGKKDLDVPSLERIDVTTEQALLQGTNGSLLQGVTLSVDNKGIMPADSTGGYLSNNFPGISTKTSDPQTKSYGFDTFIWNSNVTVRDFGKKSVGYTTVVEGGGFWNPNVQIVNGEMNIINGELIVTIPGNIASNISKSWRNWQSKLENDQYQSNLEMAKGQLQLRKIDPSNPEYDQRLQETVTELKQVQDDILGGVSGGIKVVSGVNKLFKIAKELSKAAISNPLPAERIYARVMPEKFAKLLQDGKVKLSPNADSWVTAAEDLKGITSTE